MIRPLLYLIAVFGFCACKAPAVNTKAAELKIDLAKWNYDWMAGTWKRIDADSSIQHFEEWEKKNKWDFRGRVYVVNNNERIQQEKMRLSYRNKIWSYDVIIKKKNITNKFQLFAFGALGFYAYAYEADTEIRIGYFTNLNNDSLDTQFIVDEKIEKFNFKKISKK